MLLFLSITVAQAASLDEKASQISRAAKSMEKVYESTVVMEKDNPSVNDEFYLPKGDFVIYVYADDAAFKQISFSVAWDSMEGDTADTSKRTITGSMWSNEPRFVVSNPITVKDGFGELAFEIDNLMAAINTANEKNSAQYAANSTGMSQTYTKYHNGALSKVTVTAEPSDRLLPSGRIKIVVYED